MMNRIRNSRISATMMGLALLAGFYLSGLGYCLNHGYFCGGSEGHPFISVTDKVYTHNHHKHSPDECSHHPEDPQHIHRKGVLALSGRQQDGADWAPAVQPGKARAGINPVSEDLREDPFARYYYSILFSIRSVVILS
ncbi:MAG: hypothetical protein GF417_07140 [Candidatus Latescibacteria bacterium]|nr:hypothetical protein [bacterium]MBD3424194.1 hypothetical protein [Candidatus Latescibacterota bacterium]